MDRIKKITGSEDDNVYSETHPIYRTFNEEMNVTKLIFNHYFIIDYGSQ